MRPGQESIRPDRRCSLGLPTLLVSTLMARGAWALIERKTSSWSECGTRARLDASPGTFVQLAKYHYSAPLYAACLQTQLQQTRIAFGELYRLLYRAAYNRWPELAEDATQRALVLVV